MLFTAVLTAVTAASAVLGAPSLSKRAVTDTDVLQFALTLEQLENAFYREGLARFNAAAFESAGFPSWVRGRFEQILGHEATHVQFLQQALGSAATQPCTYKFPYNDVKGFAAVSMALETVGASAYMGAAPLLQDKNTLGAAASILTVEARQAGWVWSAVLHGPAWDGPFETPLGPNAVFSLASAFLVSCPDSNPALPVAPLASLTVSPVAPTVGSTVTLKFTPPASAASSSLFLAFLRGLTPVFSPLTRKENGTYTATIPKGLQGTIYAAVVSNNTAAATADGNLLSGLVMMEFPFSASANNTSD